MSIRKNAIIFAGNLGADPEVLQTTSSSVTNLRIAVTERYKKQGSDELHEETTWMDAKIWGVRGEKFAEYHKKGDPCYVEGTLRASSWEDVDGKKHTRMYILVRDWQFNGNRSQNGAGQASASDAVHAVVDEDDASPF